MWSVIGQFNLQWHPAVARTRLIGEGLGQLRRLETRDGREIVERLAEVDNTKRSYRYTLVSGVPASHYTGVIDVKPKANGCVAEWRVDFLANNQPDIARPNHGVEIGRDGPWKPQASLPEFCMTRSWKGRPLSVRDRRRDCRDQSRERASWRMGTFRARPAALPGVAETVVDHERLASQFFGDLDVLDRLDVLALQFAGVDNSHRAALVQAEVASTVASLRRCSRLTSRVLRR